MDNIKFEERFQDLKKMVLERMLEIPGDDEIAQTLRDCGGAIDQAFEELMYDPHTQQVQSEDFSVRRFSPQNDLFD